MDFGAVAGTLAGAVVGAVIGGLGTFLLQRTAYRREYKERIAGLRREAYVHFLQSAYEMMENISEIHRDYRDGAIPSLDAKNRLRSASPKKTQASLENLRLVCDDEVAAVAARLWQHLRRSPSATGGELSPDRHEQWREEYWFIRRQLVDAARRSIGLRALDWKAAGIRPAEGSDPPS